MLFKLISNPPQTTENHFPSVYITVTLLRLQSVDNFCFCKQNYSITLGSMSFAENKQMRVLLHTVQASSSFLFKILYVLQTEGSHQVRFSILLCVALLTKCTILQLEVP